MNNGDFEDYFITIFQNSGTAGIISEDGIVFMANDKCMDLFGYQPPEMVGKPLSDLVVPEDSHILEQCCQSETCSEETNNGEIRIIDNHNEIKTTLVKIANIPHTSRCYISFLDINDQRIIEKALARSQGNFNAITESTIDGIITADAQGNIVYTNPSFRRIFGYSEEEIKGQNVTLLMPERFRESFSAKMRHFQKTGEHLLVGKIFESRGLRKDGEEFPFEMSITYWKSGKEKFQTSIVRDISQRQEAEISLKESEERLKDLFDNATDLIQMVKPDGSFLYVNKSWKETLGYSDEDIENMTIYDIIYPDHREQCELALQRVMQGQRIDKIETGFKTKNGDEIIVEGNVNAKMDSEGNVLYSRAIFRDITQRKKSEIEIQRLASIVESSGDAIVSYDLDGTILDWNDGAEKVYGYSAEEIKGKKVSIFMKQEMWEENQQNIEKIKRGEPVSHFETSRIRKDGTEIAVSISLSPMKDMDGNIVGISTITRDITEAKKAEEALKASEEKYRRIVEKFIQNALSLIGEINKV